MSRPPGLAEFDPGELLRVLGAHDVELVVIGALAAIAAGAPILSADLDVTPARSPANLTRLADALRDLDARLRVPRVPRGVAFPADAEMLATAVSWTLTTRAGPLDLVFLPAGSEGYDDLRRDARIVVIGGQRVLAASLADVIRMKEAAGRPKDLQALPILRLTLEEVRRRERAARRRPR